MSLSPKLNKPDAISMMAALKPAPVAAEPNPPTGQQKTKSRVGARVGTCQIAGHFPKSTLKALKHVMAEEETTLQALLDEAIRDLLIKKGRTKLVSA
jgi:hypothetical protein